MKQIVLQAAQQGQHVLVFDYSADFVDYKAPTDVFCQRLRVGTPEVCLNPLVGVGDQSPDLRAQQLLTLLSGVFRMGSRAKVALRNCTAEYLALEDGTPTLKGLLAYATASAALSAGLAAAPEPLDLLSSLLYCGDTPCSLNLAEPGITILDFRQVPDRSMRNFLIELLTLTTWSERTSPDHPATCPLILVFDEAQLLSWGEDSIAVRILREGRKFGIGGWFATQFVSKKSAIGALSQAAFRAYFRPDDQHLQDLAKTMRFSPEDIRLLSRLTVGQFLYKDSMGRARVITVDP